MPLKHGTGKSAIAENIKHEVHSGKPQDQAIAIAMDVAGKTKKKRRGKRPPTFDYRPL